MPRLRPDQRGSVLMLMPAAFLVLLLLGSIAVDSALVLLAQRDAHDAAFDIANDAAGAGIDLDQLRRTSDVALSPDRVRELARTHPALDRSSLRLVSVQTEGTRVRVVVETEVTPLFGRAFGARSRTVTASASVAGVSSGP